MVSTAKLITAKLESGKQPQGAVDSQYEKLKQSLARDMMGHIGIDQLSRVVIVPALDASKAPDLARLTVQDICLWHAQQTSQPQKELFSDEDLTNMMARSQQSLVGRFLGGGTRD